MVEIAGASMENDDQHLVVTFREDSGETWTKLIIIADAEEEKQKAGWAEFERLKYALDLDNVDDPSQITGRLTVSVSGGGAVTYASAPANDDRHQNAAA